jgi:2-hydroxychromene-2-carboxylate isomerase
MGELIYLDDRRKHRSRPAPDAAPAFFFDLACPESYLTAERIERTLGSVEWVPVAADVVRGGPRSPRELEAVRERAEARACALRLPLMWPDEFPAPSTRALRTAARASELGHGARFALAATRLHFCGGYDLDDLRTLTEAAAAAGVPLDEGLTAAGDDDRDLALAATADGLRGHGVTELPVIRVGRRWFQGGRGLAAAAAVLHEHRADGPSLAAPSLDVPSLAPAAVIQLRRR